MVDVHAAARIDNAYRYDRKRLPPPTGQVDETDAFHGSSNKIENADSRLTRTIGYAVVTSPISANAMNLNFALEKNGSCVRNCRYDNGYDHPSFPWYPSDGLALSLAVEPGSLRPLSLEPAAKLVDPSFAPHSRALLLLHPGEAVLPV